MVVGRRRKRGRPHRTEHAAFDERALDQLLVHGERVGGEASARVHYPTYRELAERFGISKSLVGRYATEHNCLGRRRAAQLEEDVPLEVEAPPEQVKAAVNLDAALDALSSGEGITADRFTRMAETWARQIEEAMEEGRMRPDVADLERLLRLIREVKAEPDERAGIPEGMPTLEDLQDLYEENLRRDREETPAMKGRLPIGTIPISWVIANEAQLRSMLATLETPEPGPDGAHGAAENATEC